ncbi:MAG: hypothetical protein NHB32_06140 [Fischerella sp. CENA71]|nr:hypothetical protein [Fischerella sp. CENA71]
MNQTSIVVRSHYRDPFKSLFSEFLQSFDTLDVNAKSIALQGFVKELEELETTTENESTVLHWGGIFSVFSAAAVISAFGVLNPIAGILLGGTAAASAAGVVGSALAQNRERNPTLEKLKKYRLALESESFLNWACLWEYVGIEMFFECLYSASSGYLLNDRLTRNDGKNPMAAALDGYCKTRGMKRDELISQLSTLKQASVLKLPPANNDGQTQLQQAPTEIQQPITNTQCPSFNPVTLPSLSLEQRGSTVIDGLIQGGFKVDEMLASQVVAICGTQRGGKGTLAGILSVLSKALDPSLDVQYFTAGVDVYPFACNLTSALSFPGRDSDAADKSVADELLQFLRKLDSDEPYSHKNLLLVIDEAMRLLSLLEEGDRTWAIQYLLSRFAKSGGTLIIVLHGSNLTSVVGKATLGLADTFKQSVSFIGCVAQSVKASGLRKINIASGAYFKANPNNFGEPQAGGELGAIPSWLKTEKHPLNGQPDPARTLLKFFPELVQHHDSAPIERGEKLVPKDVIARLENAFLKEVVEREIEPTSEEINEDFLSKVMLIIASALSVPVSFDAIRKSRKWKEWELSNPSSPKLRTALNVLTESKKLQGNQEEGYRTI